MPLRILFRIFSLIQILCTNKDIQKYINNRILKGAKSILRSPAKSILRFFLKAFDADAEITTFGEVHLLCKNSSSQKQYETLL